MLLLKLRFYIFPDKVSSTYATGLNLGIYKVFNARNLYMSSKMNKNLKFLSFLQFSAQKHDFVFNFFFMWPNVF